MTEWTAKVRWDKIPFHNRESISKYVEHGIKPGGFLQAVITNDLKAACVQADDINRDAIHAIVLFFHVWAPPGCWGSHERMVAWIEHKGLEGRDAMDA